MYTEHCINNVKCTVYGIEYKTGIYPILLTSICSPGQAITRRPLGTISSRLSGSNGERTQLNIYHTPLLWWSEDILHIIGHSGKGFLTAATRYLFRVSKFFSSNNLVEHKTLFLWYQFYHKFFVLFFLCMKFLIEEHKE